MPMPWLNELFLTSKTVIGLGPEDHLAPQMTSVPRIPKISVPKTALLLVTAYNVKKSMRVVKTKEADAS